MRRENSQTHHADGELRRNQNFYTDVHRGAYATGMHSIRCDHDTNEEESNSINGRRVYYYIWCLNRRHK